MSKENTAHDATFQKDPQNDRRAMIGHMKGFKDGSFPKNPFKDGKVRSAHDAPYTPHSGKVKK